VPAGCRRAIVGYQGRTLGGAIIDHRQDAETAATREAIRDEIE